MEQIRKRERATLTYTMTPLEIERQSKEVVENIREIDRLKYELKEVSSKMRTCIKDLEGDVKQATIELCNGKKEDTVDAVRVTDLTGRRQWLEFRDEIFEERLLSFEEISAILHKDQALKPITQKDIEEAVGALTPRIRNVVFEHEDTQDQDIRDIIAEETSRKSKKDHIG
jgi:hypothetical protein